jgi:probable phosphoglycerate mutase
MPAMLTLVLTRHGLTARSLPEQHLGQRIDIGLSEAGQAQAAALGQRLAGVAFERILASPLARARQTATIVRTTLPTRPDIEVDPRLAEMDYGRWEGLTYDQIEQEDAAARASWEDDPATIACPGGESGDQVAERARAFLVDLIGWHEGRHGHATLDERPVLAVAHSTLNRVLVCVATGIPVREFRRRFSQDQANLTVLRFEHGVGPSDARIVLLNDTAHLHAPSAVPWV